MNGEPDDDSIKESKRHGMESSWVSQAAVSSKKARTNKRSGYRTEPNQTEPYSSSAEEKKGHRGDLALQSVQERQGR